MYLWLKAFHIIFVISWFTGIFYLPRLFVHYCMTDDANTHERLSIMMQKLYRFTTPIAILSLFFGMWMVYENWPYFKSSLWFHVKFGLVILLFALHFYNGHLVKVFMAGKNTRSHVFYRFYNEVPTLMMFAIVILVVVRPF